MRTILVFSTAASSKEAKKIARLLTAEHLVACVNLVPKIQSYYWWKNRVHVSDEVLMMMKTTARQFSKLEQRIKMLHSYEVPEIIALPITAGSRDYLQWIQANTQ